jgi:rRNA small subunit methyltransferase G
MAPLGPEGFVAEMAAAGIDVSRETRQRLSAYLELLRRWQGAINLVGASTLADPWRRHILDCGQIAPHVPHGAASVLDLGSGAGLPGLVLALLGVPGVQLVESDGRKAQFLREAARATGTPFGSSGWSGAPTSSPRARSHPCRACSSSPRRCSRRTASACSSRARPRAMN